MSINNRVRFITNITLNVSGSEKVFKSGHYYGVDAIVRYPDGYVDIGFSDGGTAEGVVEDGVIELHVDPSIIIKQGSVVSEPEPDVEEEVVEEEDEDGDSEGGFLKWGKRS